MLLGQGTATRNRKIVIWLSAFLLLACFSALALRLASWHSSGWLGIDFKPGDPSDPVSAGLVLDLAPGGPAQNTGLAIDERVVSIEGIPANELRALNDLAARLRRGDWVTYRIDRPEGSTEIPIRLISPLHSPPLVAEILTSCLVGLISLLVSLFVFYRKSEDRRAHVLLALSMLTAVGFIGFSEPDAGNVLGFSLGWQTGLFYAAVMVVIFYIVAALLHLCLIFPRARPVLRDNPRLILWLYLAPAPLLASFVVARSLASPVDRTVSRALGLVAVIWIMAYLALVCIAVIRNHREAGPEEKRQVRWPLWAILMVVLLGFIPAIANALLFLSFGRYYIPVFVVQELSKAAFILIPLAFAFAILKHRLMEIDLLLRRTALYASLTGVVIALYFLMVGGIGGLIVNWVQIESTWIIVFATLTVAVVFIPVRNRLQSFLDKRFFGKRVDYPTFVRSLSRSLLEAGSVESLLQLVAEQLQQALQNRSVVIFMRGGGDRSYWATSKIGTPDEILGKLNFDEDSGLVDLLERGTIAVKWQVPATERRNLLRLGTSWVAPLKLKGKLIGFIALGSKLSGDDYNPSDQEFIEAVAQQAALSIDNLRLKQQDREFQTAREIQLGLLPKEIPRFDSFDIAGTWKPARAIGGDYFDVFRCLSDGVVCIGDVVGKGIPAALLMSNLQAAVRTLGCDEIPPADLCARVNRLICSNVDSGKFITFFYGTLKVSECRLVYVNAGHNPPILVRSDSSVVHLETGGPVLGVFRTAGYEQGEVALEPGDTVVIYTDGVTEARNSADEEFGEERLITVVRQCRDQSAALIQGAILERVERFCGGDFHDDVTTVVLKCVGPGLRVQGRS
jgi:serine phosphatase RsbU (regulator of sigma subunit)